MRVFVAITLTLLLLAGTYSYIAFSESVRREPPVVKIERDTGKWRIEIARTFECVPDPDSQIPALLVKLANQTILDRQEAIPATESIEIDTVENIEVGANELYVAANLATMDDFDFHDDGRQHAMRVVVFRGDSRIADQSFWLAGGNPSISETVLFHTPADPANEKTDVDHTENPEVNQ